MSDRTQKSVKNIKIVFIFYFAFLLLSFFSRKIFLTSLGAEFVGLTGTLGNILGLLSMAELGIGTAVSYHLYKPLEDNDQERINKIMSLFGWLYRYIGIFILCAGIVVSLFFPLIFKDIAIDMFIVYYAFYILLASSLIGYFINFRQILLGADQKNYIVSVYLQTGLIIKIIIQMLICKFYLNYMLWLSVDLIFAYVSCVILNRKIDKEYPWLKLSVNKGAEYRKDFPDIIKQTKQIFIHKIKDFLLTQSDQIFVFAFVSLKMVAYYGNYTLIFSKATVLFSQAFNSIIASIGSLVAENNKGKIISYFWELSVFRFYISGVIVAISYHLISPFIILWLGEEYLLSPWVLILLCFNTYLMLTRGVVDIFLHSYGLYADVWAAWAEAIINMSVTICLAIPFGLVGILLGKIASLAFIVIWWKPYYLFTKGVKQPVMQYFRRTASYYLVYIIAVVLIGVILHNIPINASDGVSSFLQYAVCTIGITVIVYLCPMYLLYPEMRIMCKRVIAIIKK